MAQIELVGRDDSRVYPFRDSVPMLSHIILFGGDRWNPVEVVALAVEDGQVISMGTLAPKDEMGRDRPSIIGIWTMPDVRGQGVGLAILCSLAEECQRRYGRPAHVDAVSRGGLALSRRAQANGVQIEVQDATLGFGVELP